MKKLLALFIITSWLILWFINSTFAVELPYWWYTYDLKKFSYNDAIKRALWNYKSKLDFNINNQADLVYKRKLDWTMTTLDHKIIKDYCQWNQKCINEDFWPAMKWQYERKYIFEKIFTDYVKVLNNKYNVLLWKEKEFQFIETDYGKDTYNIIFKNKTKLDNYFKNYLNKEKQNVLDKKITYKSANKTLTITTYPEYINNYWWEKLNDAKSRQSSNLWKAVYDYFIYLMLNDDKLYTTNW